MYIFACIFASGACTRHVRDAGQPSTRAASPLGAVGEAQVGDARAGVLGSARCWSSSGPIDLSGNSRRPRRAREAVGTLLLKRVIRPQNARPGPRCLAESFTADHKPLMGEAPEVRGFFLGCGFNSAGKRDLKGSHLGHRVPGRAGHPEPCLASPVSSPPPQG